MHTRFAARAVAIFALAVAVAAACVLGACQQQDAENDASGDADLPELRIGVDALKPFFFIDENGDYAGIDAEIAEEACRRAGYRPVFVEVGWSSRAERLSAGDIDCIWNAFVKNGREDAYRWTDSYMQSNLRAIVDAKAPDHDLQTLKGHGGMAVRAGSKIEGVLMADADLPSLQIYSCGTFEMAETAFVKGYAGALGGHEVVLRQVMNDHPGLYRFLDDTIMTVDLGVAFSKEDDSDRCDKIGAAIDDMKADGTIDTIVSRYDSDLTGNGEATEHAES